MSTRVLVVDDEEAVRRNFRALLEDAGYTVFEASDGEEGLATFGRERPDIVLTDLRMRSSKDGLALVSSIRHENDEVPVVVVSGSGTLQDAIDAIHRGAWDYLVKPVQLSEELLVAIERNLERSRLLRENRVYRDKLEEMVAERTASLLVAQRENQMLQTRLMHAQKLEALGLLAGGIAHDFNNVLMVVRYGLDEIRAALGSGHEEALATIEEGIKQASDLTRQIFVFSGRAPANAVPCDLRALVTRMEKLLRAAMKDGVVLKTDLAAVPSIRADAIQLQQVIMNLVINAAESMSDKGIVSVRAGTIELASEPGRLVFLTEPPRPGTYVSLVVEDAGAGMDEATLRRVGDPFFTTKARGQGLGLTTVVGIMRGLGGGLAVESELGKGTRFTAAFPTFPVAPDQTEPRSILARA